MDKKLIDIIHAINAAPPFSNPVTGLHQLSAGLSAAINSTSDILAQLIMDSIPPPLAPLTEIVIPAREQAWINRVEAFKSYADGVQSGANQVNGHLNIVVTTYSENIGLHSTGASVLDAIGVNGDEGVNKFNQAYALVKADAEIDMTATVAALNAVLAVIPTSYDETKIEAQLQAVEAKINASVDYAALFSAAISTEGAIKAELVKAAKDYVLASQSQTWSGSSHTAAILDATASEQLLAALAVTE